MELPQSSRENPNQSRGDECSVAVGTLQVAPLFIAAPSPVSCMSHRRKRRVEDDDNNNNNKDERNCADHCRDIKQFKKESNVNEDGKCYEKNAKPQEASNINESGPKRSTSNRKRKQTTGNDSSSKARRAKRESHGEANLEPMINKRYEGIVFARELTNNTNETVASGIDGNDNRLNADEQNSFERSYAEMLVKFESVLHLSDVTSTAFESPAQEGISTLVSTNSGQLSTTPDTGIAEEELVERDRNRVREEFDIQQRIYRSEILQDLRWEALFRDGTTYRDTLNHSSLVVSQILADNVHPVDVFVFLLDEEEVTRFPWGDFGVESLFVVL